MEATLLELVDRLPVLVRRSTGEILHWTKGCSDLFGYSPLETHGRIAGDMLGTIYPEPLERIETRLATEGEWKGRLQHKSRLGEIWTEAVWKLKAGDPAGDVIVEQHTDITARVELEKRSALLARELEHRVNNIISVVQAIVRRTFPDAPVEQQRKLDDRLMALAGANKILHEASWKEAGLRSILSKIAQGLGVSERIRAEGPDLSVSPPHAMGLALAVHELCTNALKYGALSQATGFVSVSWSPDEEDVQIIWREHGGPPVVLPKKPGFGTTLITNAIPGGTSPVEISYDRTGVICKMRLPYEKATV